MLLHCFCHFKSKLHKRKKCNHTKKSKQQNNDLWENIYNFTSQRTNIWKVLQIWDKRQNSYRKKKTVFRKKVRLIVSMWKRCLTSTQKKRNVNKLYWGIISHISDGQKSKSWQCTVLVTLWGNQQFHTLLVGVNYRNPAISLLGTYPIDRLTLNNSFTDLVITELFVIAKYWKHSNVHSKELIK